MQLYLGWSDLAGTLSMNVEVQHYNYLKKKKKRKNGKIKNLLI